MNKEQVIEMFNWDWIEKQMETAEANTPFGSDVPVKSVYVGRVFTIFPSGKYYTPFACSNVTEEEAEQDEQFSALLNEILSEKGMFMESGEGDPTDVFFCRPAEQAEEEEEVCAI